MEKSNNRDEGEEIVKVMGRGGGIVEAPASALSVTRMPIPDEGLLLSFLFYFFLFLLPFFSTFTRKQRYPLVLPPSCRH